MLRAAHAPVLRAAQSRRCHAPGHACKVQMSMQTPIINSSNPVTASCRQRGPEVQLLLSWGADAPAADSTNLRGNQPFHCLSVQSKGHHLVLRLPWAPVHRQLTYQASRRWQQLMYTATPDKGLPLHAVQQPLFSALAADSAGVMPQGCSSTMARQRPAFAVGTEGTEPAEQVARTANPNTARQCNPSVVCRRRPRGTT